MTVTNYLFVGADRPTTYSELAERMGITHRQAEIAVQEARLNHEPIVSGSRGLWLAATDEEALAWVERQRSRAIHLMESAQGVQRGVEARRAIGEQTSIGWAA
jgi:hypothetical protein